MTQQSPIVFRSISTDAQVGDFFQLPWTATAQVLSRSEFPHVISYSVKIGGKTETWDVPRPESGLEAQERDRLEAEASEEEMSGIIHFAAVEEFYDYIFGMTGEQMASRLPPAENGYHDPAWTADDRMF